MFRNHNLYAILAASFPSERSACAIAGKASDTSDPSNASQPFYSWDDVDAATAHLANLLHSLGLPPAAQIASVDIPADHSVEAALLYLATLRAGLVYLPLSLACQPGELGEVGELVRFLDNARPSVLVCAPEAFARFSKSAFTAGVSHVFTLGSQQSGSLLQRAARHAPQFDTAQSAASDPALVVYKSTSSTGAVWSHGDLSANAPTLGSVLGC